MINYGSFYFTTGHSIEIRLSSDMADVYVFGPRGGYKTVIHLREEDLDKFAGALTEALMAMQEIEDAHS